MLTLQRIMTRYFPIATLQNFKPDIEVYVCMYVFYGVEKTTCTLSTDTDITKS